MSHTVDLDIDFCCTHLIDAALSRGSTHSGNGSLGAGAPEGAQSRLDIVFIYMGKDGHRPTVGRQNQLALLLQFFPDIGWLDAQISDTHIAHRYLLMLN